MVEVNLEPTQHTHSDVVKLSFQGRAGELLPALLAVEREVQELQELQALRSAQL